MKAIALNNSPHPSRGLQPSPAALGLVLVFLLCPVSPTRAQADLEPIIQVWKQGQYGEALQALKAYRDQPFGKTAEVDYMIASSMCRIPGLEETGQKYFGWLLYNYPLDKVSRSRVVADMKNCASTNQPVVINFVVVRTGTGARVGGKMMFPVKNSGLPVTSVPVKVLREIPASEMATRLFPLSDPSAGIAKIKSLLGSESTVVARSHFLLASGGQIGAASGSQLDEDIAQIDTRQKRLRSRSELNEFADTLESYLSFFISEYNMRIPDRFITVYCFPSSGAVQKAADTLHGIEISPLSIGYSFRDDLSLVGLFDGTLIHELFHLLVHNDFGDVPPWLDEGGAALYEGSVMKNGRAMGRSNWRGEVLRSLWDRRPSIEALIKMDWQGFDDAPGDFRSEVQALNHATARYFMLWLQEKHKLKELYLAFRNRNVEKGSSDPTLDAVRLVEKVTGLKVAALDKEFDGWWKTNFAQAGALDDPNPAH